LAKDLNKQKLSNTNPYHNDNPGGFSLGSHM